MCVCVCGKNGESVNKPITDKMQNKLDYIINLDDLIYLVKAIFHEARLFNYETNLLRLICYKFIYC